MYNGIIVFKKCNSGSKSEGIYPFLYIGNGAFIRVFDPNDNPFTNENLHTYDGQAVTIEGALDENEILLVQKITHAEDISQPQVTEDKTDTQDCQQSEA